MRIKGRGISGLVESRLPQDLVNRHQAIAAKSQTYFTTSTHRF